MKRPIFTLFLLLLLVHSTSFSQPVIKSFSPTSGPVGTTITITGKGFNENADKNIVFFGAVKANVLTATATTITVAAPAGATYESISVSNKQTHLTGYASQPFVVTFPGADYRFLPNSFSDTIKITTGYIQGACDFDGDGKTDLLSYTYAGNIFEFNVIKNESTPNNLVFKEDLNNKFKGIPVATADFDGDGNKDIVADTGYSTFLIYKNVSSKEKIFFEEKAVFTDNGYFTVTGDINNDGKPDIMRFEQLSHDERIFVFENTSNDSMISFEKHLCIHQNIFERNSYSDMQLSDLDGDGKLDIILVISNYSYSVDVYPGWLKIFRNTSTGDSISFEFSGYFSGGYLNQVAAGDLNGDQKPDILVTASNDWDYNNITYNYVNVLLNTSSPGNIAFGSGATYHTEKNSYNVYITDFNGDAKPDFLAGSAMFQNKSTKSYLLFSDSVNYNFSNVQTIADIDLDGKSDIVTDNSVFRNQVNYPYIKKFNPDTASKPGDKITILGYNFTGATDVSFGGVPALYFKVRSDNMITAFVKRGASGNIVVTTNEGYDSLSGFIYAPPQPYFDAIASDKSIILKEIFSVYPNPAKDVLHVTTNGSTSFSLISKSGKILLTTNIDKAGSINVSTLAAGEYYLRNNATNVAKKVVIVR
jgi:hypothetical protein